MITRHDVKSVLEQLTEQDIKAALGDYLTGWYALECNSMGLISLHQLENTEENENEIRSNGDFFSDLDGLQELVRGAEPDNLEIFEQYFF